MPAISEPELPSLLCSGSSALHLGDCAAVLPQLGSNLFDLIYVDPPYNAGGTRSARLERGLRASGQAAYRDHWGGKDGFLQMLEPRLRAMHSVLAERGTLWVHLDHRAVHETKVLLDGIFGDNRFQGEIIWVPGNGGKRRSGPNVTHQTILIYSKSEEFLYNTESPALREPYADTSQRMHFKNVDEQGRRYRERTINGRIYRYYADVGRRLGSVWLDCPAMHANTPLRTETTGYPTQKPESLLERIVLAATEPESRVLDPMCGSGTTLAVAARLGRTFVGIDESPVAFQVAGSRLGLLANAPGEPSSLEM